MYNSNATVKKFINTILRHITITYYYNQSKQQVSMICFVIECFVKITFENHSCDCKNFVPVHLMKGIVLRTIQTFSTWTVWVYICNFLSWSFVQIIQIYLKSSMGFISCLMHYCELVWVYALLWTCFRICILECIALCQQSERWK